MAKINRRKFLHTGIAGAAALGAGLFNISYNPVVSAGVDKVTLGESGLIVPRIAFGTGSHAGGSQSNQTRLGTRGFVRLARHACDRGLKFFDMADTYGSHTYVRELLKEVPREETTLLTKIWTTDTSWYKTEPVEKTLDRFRLETGSDYFDIVLMHCLMRGDWQETSQEIIDGFSRAKEKGAIKAVGVSCHDWDAMVAAVNDPWVDVIMARINPFGTHMDGSVEDVMALLETARKNGKGIIGMKIFGNGDNTSVEERQRSIEYAIKSPNVHCITLGMETIEEVDDAVDRVMRLV